MSKYGTKAAPKYGYRTLDPLPTRIELDEFFAETYYSLIDDGKRAADIARSRRGGSEADDQEKWLRETVHADLIDILKKHAPGKRVAEVGCGLGGLLNDLAAAGFDPVGIDVAPTAVAAVKQRGIEAFEGAIDILVASGAIGPGSYDAILFNNVLEFTHNPLESLSAAAEALKPGGILLVRGANDFNALQMAAVDTLGLEEWWISAPGHVNYLNFEAVEGMMRDVGVSPFHRHGEFPMEIWLLLGFNYIGNGSLGADCHQRRVAFERSIPSDVRRRLYRALGDAGFGRTMVIAGRRS